jgi:hypothetical protein
MVCDRLMRVGFVEERHDIGTDLVDVVMTELRLEGLFSDPAPTAERARLEH